MKNATRTAAALIAASTLALVSLSACAENKPETTADSTAASSAAETSAAEASATDTSVANEAEDGPSEEEGAVAVNARPDECGLQEQQGPEASLGPIDISVHYFQPGEMVTSKNATMTMLPYADSEMHLEVDTKANEYGTNWGWSVDETPADLRMFYKLTDSSGKELAQGMMMEMNAIDGSHYGTNLPNDTITEPGDYTLEITVYPPLNYALHADYITGVPAKGWFKPLTVIMPWKITQENLDIVEANKRKDPMSVPADCKDYPVKMFQDPTAEAAMKKAEETTPLPMMTGETKGGEDAMAGMSMDKK